MASGVAVWRRAALAPLSPLSPMGKELARRSLPEGSAPATCVTLVGRERAGRPVSTYGSPGWVRESRRRAAAPVRRAGHRSGRLLA